MAGFEGIEFFSAEEFNHLDKMDNELISMLELARAAAGVPFIITSDWRPVCDGKSHHLCRAVDIRCRDARSLALINHGAVLSGFRRIGWYYKEIVDGQHQLGHVHLDINTAEDGFDQDVSWIGISR